MDTERLLQIIKAVKARDCLWNAASPKYAKRHILERAWSEVAREVGQSEVYCREKWRNVRTGFLRSIQNNIRIVANENSNDFQAVRRKRFYLYEHLKFLLPSVKFLDKTRKRRKSAKKFNCSDSIDDDEYSDNTMLESYRSPVGKCEINSENEQSMDQEQPPHDEQQVDVNIDSNYHQLLKELEKSDDDAIRNNDKDSSTFKRQSSESEKQQLATDTNNKQCRNVEQDTTDTESPWTCYERESQQMLDFFRGNINDILTLTKRNQRRFKRKLLEIIEELHDSEEATRN